MDVGIITFRGDVVKSEKELFNLAKMYVVLNNELQRRLQPECEIDEIKDSLEEIRNTLLEKNYDVNKFLHYQQLYKEMSIKEYFEFIKTLE